ncbi:hypothetical protein AB0H34_07910 [Saccharopolyspora shandongensis]|uniref:hypothetical protein n=1 Tax=Saccharopolyspora shandongensis TaxID=418495 RepID=UPI0033C37FEE
MFAAMNPGLRGTTSSSVPHQQLHADPGKIARLNIRRRDRLGGILHEYEHAA